MHTAVYSDMVGAVSEKPGGACDATHCTEGDPCNPVTKHHNQFGDMEWSHVSYVDIHPETGGVWPRSIYPNVKKYNEFGQVIEEFGGCEDPEDTSSCARHTSNVYTSDDGDTAYKAFIRKEIAHVPAARPWEEDRQFASTAKWDAGFAQITNMVSADGSEAQVDYDALGRFEQAFGPRLDTGTLCLDEPVKRVTYHYSYFEGAAWGPMSMMETWVNTSQTRCGHDPWSEIGEAGHDDRSEVIYTWVDSVGKPYAAVVSGDDHLGSDAKYRWVVNGEGYLNAKGMAWQTCEGRALDAAVPPSTPAEIVGALGTNNCSIQQFDYYGRPTIATAADGTQAKAVYRVDEGDSWDHHGLHDSLDSSGDPTGWHQGVYSTQRVDGFGRAVVAVSRYRTSPGGPMVERHATADFDALGNVIVARQFEVPSGGDPETDAINQYSRRAKYDTLGRLRENLDLNFGKWKYEYDRIGQLEWTTSPTGDIGHYYYDNAGRLTIEEYKKGGGATDFEIEAEYFYDDFPVGQLPEIEDAVGFPTVYPEWAVTLGRLVAVRDKSGVTVSAGDFGSFSESWKQLNPDHSSAYRFASLSDYAGQVVYSEDPDGLLSLPDYYDDGTFRSSYVEYKVRDETDPGTFIDVRKQIVKSTRSNILGQTELVEYADGGNTSVWNGYDPVNHRNLGTVVQQQWGEGTDDNVTLMAFGYHYNKLGGLTSVADWRGRDSSSSSDLAPNALHPAAISHTAAGYNEPNLPSGFDTTMRGPVTFNDVSPGTASGWPIGAAPSDAAFGYDGLNRLVREDRDYITAAGDDDWIIDGENTGTRVRSVTWGFDARDSMDSWVEEAGEADGITGNNLGRALGGQIVNGWELNQTSGCDNNHLAANAELPDPGTCYIPDALYFATNAGDPDVADYKGTCVWVGYDYAGRMTSQTVFEGCNSCSFTGGPLAADCHETDSTRTDYLYSWNALGQLEAAKKYIGIAGLAVNETTDTPEIVMTYRYDAAGGRVIREKSNVTGLGDPTDIFQDLYISGAYERRKVKLFEQNTTHTRSAPSIPIPQSPLRSRMWRGPVWSSTRPGCGFSGRCRPGTASWSGCPRSS